MGTITKRIRSDGTAAYTVQIRRKEGGRVVHTEARTFDREAAAKIWMRKRESELDKIDSFADLVKDDPPLVKIIEQYRKQGQPEEGKTKRSVLDIIAQSDFAQLKASKITSQAIVSYAQELLSKPMQPQTVANYLSHLAPVFAIAKPAWGYPLHRSALDDARAVLKQLRVISKSAKRDRRPTLDELERLLSFFKDGKARAPQQMPMHEVVLFAIFSCRRLDEITRLQWADIEHETMRVWVRNMKHPSEKTGNDALLTLTPEAYRLINARASNHVNSPRIFDYNPDSISTRFTRGCKILGIENLHFHDLRHDGISRLFEMGWTIPQVATVSGHRSWTVMQRYTHIQQRGDKYDGLLDRWLE